MSEAKNNGNTLAHYCQNSLTILSLNGHRYHRGFVPEGNRWHVVTGANYVVDNAGR